MEKQPKIGIGIIVVGVVGVIAIPSIFIILANIKRKRELEVLEKEKEELQDDYDEYVRPTYSKRLTVIQAHGKTRQKREQDRVGRLRSSGTVYNNIF